MSTTTSSATATTAASPTFDLADLVLDVARRDPDRIAVIDESRGIGSRRWTRTTTYATLSDRAESVAVGLRDIGVHEGTLCSFMVPPGEDAMVLALALWRVGAAMVGIEPHSHGLRNIARSLARVGPTVFFGSPEAHVARRAFGWGRGSVHTDVVVGPRRVPGAHTLASLERPWPSEPRRTDAADDDPALIAFTTGSTGTPKPTVMTRRNLAMLIRGISEQWKLGDGRDIVDMPTFPIFWIIGMSHGGTVVVPPMNFATKGPGDANPARLAETIRRNNVHSMFGSPALLANLATHCADHDVVLPSIRRIVAGGAEVPGPLFAAVKAVLGDGEMYSDYGATEVLPATEIAGDVVVGETWARTERGEGLCVGAPLAGVETRIVAIDDGPIATMEDATVLATGSVGEVVVRSPHVSDRYYESPTDMADNKIADGDALWHRLGDTGFLDESGRLWLCGRRSHRVVAAGRTYYPLCCEPVINAHPDVAASALIGIRDGGGDGPAEPAMCVELVTNPSRRIEVVEAELAALAGTCDATRGITRFIVIDRLPVDRRHNAKIDRPALSARFSR
ncbi:MAG: AMP-binding protein [Microthrixaceae bacterium]|nr:AMP-binding protein [Microthrixaceae bacterium]